MINLMLGDCLERMKEIPDGSVDMVLTDPPYGMDFQSNRRVVQQKFAKIANDKNLDWVDSFIDECHRVMTVNSALYFFCSWHNIDYFKQAIERKFKIKNMIVWVKNNHGSGDLKGGYAPQHEIIFYACKGRVLNRGKRLPDIIYADKIPSSKLVHPTEKKHINARGFCWSAYRFRNDSLRSIHGQRNNWRRLHESKPQFHRNRARRRLF